MATGQSDCTNPTNDAECLQSSVTVDVDIEYQPLAVSLDLSLALQGTWKEPLGLKNFAVVDPACGFGIDLLPKPPKPKKVSWSLVLLYTESGSWPSNLLSIDRPLSFIGSSDLVEVRTDFYLDLDTPSGSLPKFGVSHSAR